MQRLASVRFACALSLDERAAVARTVASAGASLRSWAAVAERTYLAAAYEDAGVPAALASALPGADVDVPALLPLRVVCTGAAEVAVALTGPGGPDGVAPIACEPGAVVVELRPARTSLALVVALVDAACAHDPARRIEPLLPLGDETLAAFAGALLGDAALDAARLVEPHAARAARRAR